MKKELKLYGIGVLLLLVACTCAAQKKNNENEVMRVPPKAILVMLFTENNRREALAKAGRVADTPVLRKDMLAVRDNTVKDFTLNFDYCPVYYYMDENHDAVMARRFEGVLLDSTLQPAKNIIITDTNYLIVYYGSPEWQSQQDDLQVTEMTAMGGKPNGSGLVVNNHEMKQVGYNYWLPAVNSRKKTLSHDFKYVSKRFNIEYYPLALELDSKLMLYADKYARRQRDARATANEGAKQ